MFFRQFKDNENCEQKYRYKRMKRRRYIRRTIFKPKTIDWKNLIPKIVKESEFPRKIKEFRQFLLETFSRAFNVYPSNPQQGGI